MQIGDKDLQISKLIFLLFSWFLFSLIQDIRDEDVDGGYEEPDIRLQVSKKGKRGQKKTFCKLLGWQSLEQWHG